MHRFLEASADDYMTRTVKTVGRDATMRELQRMFDEVDFNCFPVIENNGTVGLVTKFDFLKCFAFTTGRMVPSYDDLLSRTVAEVMTPDGQTPLTDYSEDGVDLTLIRWFLSLTPAERLQSFDRRHSARLGNDHR